MSFKKLVGLGTRIMACAMFTVVIAGQARAQTYPSKPIRLIVPSPGATDVICRLMAEKLRVSLGQPIVVETKAGAGTTIASAFVANSPPDGHTLLCGISALLTAQHYYSEVRYDPLKDFAPVALMVKVAHVLLIRSDLPINNVRELVAYASANPDKLTFGSSGVGTSNYLGAALFQNMARVKLLHVPYKGGAPALQDLVGGRIDILFDVPQGGVPFVQSGKLHALGVTTDERLAAFPDWPTISEAGVPGYASFPWAGILAPAKTPPEIVKRLNLAIQEALNSPDIQKRYKEMGLNISGGTPAQFRTFMEQETEKWTPIIERLKKDAS
jgi:tripartite-type tricarboxylate transporter receptor subunit TctC